ncbi:MAG: Bax inhibitor-1 family protein [Candidatus Dormibacteraeota bacterium]|nr:Bax inhibitor-1 family protein [Candidatus Dormibacteraeota bacterium]MBO0745059.1 Bax inhibitor-1 family protein [Candidatus Dormibacteraeota bacterium]
MSYQFGGPQRPYPGFGGPQPYARPAIGGSTLSAVFGLLGLSALFTAGGALVSIVVGGGVYWIGLIGMFVTLIALQFLRERSPINLILTFAFATLVGFMLGAILEAYIAAGLGNLVLSAAAATGAVSTIAGFVGYTTKRNLTRLGPALFIALLALIVAMVIGFFVHLALMQMLISAAGAVIFTLFLAVDLNRVARTEAPSQGTVIMLAVSVYLDILNLFLFLLSLLGMTSGSRR